MKAFAKFKCFRHGYDFTGDWNRIIDLIILIIVISFSKRLAQTVSPSARCKQNLQFDCEDSRPSEAGAIIASFARNGINQ
jgi:hypothetical protein